MRQTNNGWYLFKVKNKDIWTISEICSKLIITMKKYVEFIQIQQQENHRNGVSCHFDVILATFDAVFLFVRSASSYGQNLSCLFQQIFRCLRHPRELFWSAYFCSLSECRRTRFSVRIFSYYVFSSEHADHINLVFLRFLTFPA